MRSDGSFVDDQRGVTAALGFVLMFALVMTTFAIYQSDVVPHQNAEIESSYSQSLDGEVSELRSTTIDVAASGASAAETIQGAPDYPDRALGINAPPPKSRLSTTAEHNVSVAGLNSSHEQYWNGTKRPFKTRLLAFEPSYNYIRTEEAYYLANGVGVREAGNGSYARSVGGEVVDGNQIDIVLLEGDVGQQGSVHDVTVESVSTTTEYHSVNVTRNPSDSPPAFVRVPTVRDGDAWQEVADSSANISRVDMYCGDSWTPMSPSCSEEVNGAAIILERGNYSLRMTKVSLEEPSTPDPTYVTMEPSGGVTASSGQTFTATVRDKYGNPVPDASVTLKRTGPGVLTASSVTTDDSGQAIFGVKHAEIGVTQVTAKIDDVPPDYKKTSRVVGGPGAGGTPTFAAYTSGQYRPGMGDIGEMNLSNGQTVPSSDTDCLLVGDTGGGLLGGLLGAIQCDSDNFRTLQGSLIVTSNNEQFTVKYYLFDEDGDGSVTDGDDGGGIVIESNKSSDSIFDGDLTDDAASRMMSDTGVDILDVSNYNSPDWDNDYGCYDDCGVFDGTDQEGHEAISPYDDGDSDGGYANFDDVEMTGSDVFVEEALGRVTVTTKDN
jgi:hypothetical protein